MNYPYEQPVKKLVAEEAVIKKATIVKHSDKPEFGLTILVFFVGALSFAIALAYNNLAQSVIKKYSFGDGIFAQFVNLGVFTSTVILMLYMIWKVNPRATVAAL